MNARDGSIAPVNEAKAAAPCLGLITPRLLQIYPKKTHEQKPYHHQLSPLIEFEESGSNRGANKIGRRYKPYSPLLHLCKTATTLLQTKAPSLKTQQGKLHSRWRVAKTQVQRDLLKKQRRKKKEQPQNQLKLARANLECMNILVQILHITEGDSGFCGPRSGS